MPSAQPSRLSWRGGRSWGGSLRGWAALALLGLATGLALLWVSTYWANFGVGAGPTSVPNGVFLEVTTVTDGPLIVLNGTRTDDICYDGPTGWEYGPFESLHLLIIEKIGGPHIWWPRIKHPAPWCGPYVFVPLWLPILICLGLGCALALRRRHPPGTCTACGYPLAGLPPGAPCPECGLVQAGGVAHGFGSTAPLASPSPPVRSGVHPRQSPMRLYRGARPPHQPSGRTLTPCGTTTRIV